MDGNLLRFRKGVKYAFIDCETYNLCLNFRQNRPWQIGVLEVVDETIVSAHDIWVLWPDAPHLKVGKEAAFITRYSEEEHLKKGILPEEAFYKFWPILEEADYIIWHNGLKFDIYLLKGFAERMGADWKWLATKCLDTKALAQGIKMNIPYNSEKEPFFEYQYKMANSFARGIKTRLEILGKEYGIDHDYDKLHDAIVDLELNLKVWNKIKYQVEI
jgi:DNA polymerase III epsilon subunit-like protein